MCHLFLGFTGHSFCGYLGYGFARTCPPPKKKQQNKTKTKNKNKTKQNKKQKNKTKQKNKKPYSVDEVILSDSIAGTMGCNFAFVNITGNKTTRLVCD